MKWITECWWATLTEIKTRLSYWHSLFNILHNHFFEISQLQMKPFTPRIIAAIFDSHFCLINMLPIFANVWFNHLRNIKCGPPKLDHCNAPLYGYLTALWKGYSTSKWKKLPQLRKEANKDKYRFSSKLTDALNEEKCLCLARNLDKFKKLLKKGDNLSAAFDTFSYDILLSHFLI